MTQDNAALAAEIVRRSDDFREKADIVSGKLEDHGGYMCQCVIDGITEVIRAAVALDEAARELAERVQ